MKLKEFNGIKIGAIFSAVSLVLTFTYVIPIASVMPGVFIEEITSNFVNNEPYSNVGKITLTILTVLFVSTLIISIYYVIKKKSESRKMIISIMVIMYFIVHPLAMYIYWALELDYRDDGQLIFIVIETFPFSSITFILVGIVLDLATIIGLKRTDIS